MAASVRWWCTAVSKLGWAGRPSAIARAMSRYRAATFVATPAGSPVGADRYRAGTDNSVRVPSMLLTWTCQSPQCGYSPGSAGAIVRMPSVPAILMVNPAEHRDLAGRVVRDELPRLG